MNTCCIVAASDFNPDDFSRKRKAGVFDAIIAVDGGFQHLRASNCTPDVVIGDFDSLGYVPADVSVIRHPAHKDKSDLELALDYALGKGFTCAFVYGALGGRLDHSIANLQMCARFAEEGIDVMLVGIDQGVKILVGPGSYELPLVERGTVSVFSAVNESHDVCEDGLEYPLDNATLTNRTTLGLSNELVGNVARVSVGSGTLFIFHPLDV